jgi:uncharacterized protein (UPF0276 family)
VTRAVPSKEALPRRAIPARAGIGLRAVHHDALLTMRPDVGWLEAHSENYFADGGAQVDYLMRLRELYPLSLHGVGLSLGTTDPLDREHLRLLRRTIDRFQPALVSEHVCWGAVGGVHFNDLLPLPCTHEALRHLVDRVSFVQDFLGRRILLENVSSYLQYRDDELPEWAFLAALARESGCGLLLDVNNVYVSACNHGFDARDYLAHVPVQYVQEIHLAGHTVNRHGDVEIRIDTHSAPVCPAVWDLYEFAVARFGPVPTLIEWDTDIPGLEVLVAEAHRADARLERVRGLAA